MSDTITQLLVQIKGDASGIVASFKDLGSSLTTANAQVSVLDKSLKSIGDTGEKSTGHIHGLTFAVRSLFDQIRFGVGVGGPMALFYAFDEATRALVANKDKLAAMGISLVDLLGPGGVIAAAIAASFGVWEGYSKHLGDATKAHKKLMDELERIPGAVDKAFQAFKVGAISFDQLTQIEGYLSGKIPLYKHNTEFGPNGGVPTMEQLDNLTPQSGFTATPTGKRPFYVSNLPTTPADVQAQVDKIIASGYAANAGKVAQNEEGQAQQAQETKQDKPILAASKNQEEQLQKNLELQKKYQELLDDVPKKIEEISAKQFEADKKHEEELARQQTLQQEIARATVEASLRGVQGNDFLTGQEKNSQSIPLFQEMLAQNQARIAQLAQTAATTSDTSAQLEAQKQITELIQQQVELQQRLNTAAGANSWGYQMQLVVTRMRDIPALAQQIGSLIDNTINRGISTVASNISQVIVGTKSWHQALKQIGETMLTDIIDAILQIIEKELIVLAVDTAIKIVSGFAAGGYTGDGPTNQVAGVVHGQEWVTPANRTAGARGLLQAIHRGDLSDASAPRGSGGVSMGAGSASSGSTKIEHNTSHYIYTDKSKMARAIEQDDAHESWVVDVMARNAYKIKP